jgi:hypothetical protein
MLSAGQALADPASWNTQTAPAAQATDTFLKSVSCPSTSFCVAVGSAEAPERSVQMPLAEHWDGNAWTIQDPPVPAGMSKGDLKSVSCTTATTCIAVGLSYPPNGSPTPLAERWDGTSWTMLDVPVPGRALAPRLNGVSCASDTECIAVGTYVDGDTRSRIPFAEHWDGSHWSLQTVGSAGMAGGSELNAVSCSSATACTAVGAGEASPLVLRWNGIAWTRQFTPDLPALSSTNLLGTSCPSATTCTAVGFSQSSSFGPLAERWDGVSWTTQPTPAVPQPGGTFNQVSCPSTSACVAVGDNAVLDRWAAGSGWMQETVPLPGADSTVFMGVSCPKTHVCTAVGYYWSPVGALPLVERYE